MPFLIGWIEYIDFSFRTKRNVCFCSSEGWATCSPGFFLRGFHRGSSDELKSIQWATCCKPSLHPYSYPDCYDQDAGQEPLRQCSREGFLLVGLYRGAGEQLSSIKKLRCCKMIEGIYKQVSNSSVSIFVVLLIRFLSSQCHKVILIP